MLTYFTSSIQRSKIPAPLSEPPDGPDDDPAKKAAMTQANESLFHEMLRVVEVLCERYPNESKTEFKRPLQWVTTLRASAFGPAVGGFVLSNSKNSKSVVTSVANRSDNGQPLFAIEQAGDGLYIAKVNTFEYLNKALQLSDQDKIREVQELLQANRNPLRNVLGLTVDPSNPGKALIDAFDAWVVSDADPGNTAVAGSAQKRDGLRTFRLSLVLNSFDLRLFRTAVQTLEKDRIVTMDKVQDEVTMLQSFCGAEEKCALSSVDWESDYTFANGYRAPPWRQVYGELCYIEIQPMDREKFIVTASKNGYFVNKGYAVDGKGTDRLNYEQVGSVYPTLVNLLKAESKHFGERIDHQEYLYRPELISESIPTSDFLGGDGVRNRDGDDHDGLNSTEEARGEGLNGIMGTSTRKPETGRGRHGAANKEGGIGGVGEAQGPTRRKAKSNAKDGGGGAGSGSSKHAHSGEPSLKWRALGLTPENGDAQGKAKGRSTKKSIGSGGGAADRSGRIGGAGAGAAGSSGKATDSAGKSRRGRKDDQEEDFSESETEESSEEDMQEKRQESSELPAEYWQIQKLVKYLRVGNQTATIIAICSLRDFDLRNETNQLAIRDVGGLDTLVNLLDTDDPKCKIGSLQILKEICQNVQIRSAIADLDGVQPLVDLLKDSNEELKCLAAETIAHCARNSKNRRAVRRYGGIRKLVRLLKTSADNQDERVAISGALALSSCSKSAKNKEAIQAAGSIPLLAKLLQSSNQKLLIPVVGILQECASDEHYRIAIRASGMIKFLVENLSSNNEELQTNCASAIFKCAEDDETRSLVQQYGGLAPLVNLLDNPANKELLVAATGAVWKCSQNLENVAAFNSLNTIKKLVGLMENQPEEVLVNVVGALGACAQTADGRQAIRESGGITPLVNLLTGTNQALLVNVTTAVGACALDGESMAIIDRLDGVRLLWSLLKSPNHHVQASAAWAICPCIEHAKDAGEMVRSFVGGLELIVSLLKSESIDVLASVCAAIANIAKDEENLAVITDHGVVPMLAKLTTTRDDRLRKHLAEAIACCCHWGNNKVAFGTAGAVAPLVKYLKSPEVAVHRSTARALHQLSMDPDNCITMHEHGVVKLLLGMVGSADEVLQEAAAGTIGNIRRLALASEKATMG